MVLTTNIKLRRNSIDTGNAKYTKSKKRKTFSQLLNFLSYINLNLDYFVSSMLILAIGYIRPEKARLEIPIVGFLYTQLNNK